MSSADSSWKNKIDLPETTDVEVIGLNSKNYLAILKGLDSSKNIMFVGYSIGFSDVQQKILDKIVSNRNSIIVVDTGDKNYTIEKIKKNYRTKHIA